MSCQPVRWSCDPPAIADRRECSNSAHYAGSRRTRRATSPLSSMTTLRLSKLRGPPVTSHSSQIGYLGARPCSPHFTRRKNETAGHESKPRVGPLVRHVDIDQRARTCTTCSDLLQITKT